MKFFSLLYTSTLVDRLKLKKYLEEMEIGQLEKKDWREMEEKITKVEIEQAIDNLKNGKAPGGWIYRGDL